MRKELLYASIGGLFVTAQVLTAIRGEKLPFMPEEYNFVPAGVIAYLSIFVIANIINEKEGPKEKTNLIIAGIFVNFLFLLNLLLESMIPEKTGVFPDYTHSTFNWLLGTEARIVFGSLMAFVVAMYLNNFLYHKWKKHIYVKYVLILILVMAIDTVLFHTIAYTGTIGTNDLLGSIASVTILKIILSVVSIPVFGFGLKGYSYWEQASLATRRETGA
ncbi:MAG: queuosine precursor transporter [Thermoplasmata archaeon]|nr:queuosine precursor transporter [Thermoplasmata archaeon]MCK4454823.1 queuosine precursor transporter [Thermoplasmata archaeon]